MTFILNDSHYYACFWFVAFDGFDYMAAAFKVGKPKDQQVEWNFLYRFRYYTADPIDPFAEDENHWEEYKVSGNTPEAEIEAKCEETVNGLVEVYVKNETRRGIAPWHQKYRIPIHGTGDAALQELMKQPWAHCRTEPTTSLKPPKQHLGH